MMKITTKIILALVVPIFVLSCALAEAELSDRDWSDIKSKYAPQRTDVTSSNYLPTYAGGTPMTAGSELIADKEIVIVFPDGVDVLKSSDSAIGAKLKTFLTIYTYNGGEVDDNTGLTKLGDVQAYTFVERRVNAANTQVTLRLDNAVPELNMVAKIDATKYTFRDGHKVDKNNDGKAGEAIYDDSYLAIAVAPTPEDTSGKSFIPPGNVQNWSLNIAFPDNVPQNDISEKTITVATLSGTGLDDDDKIDIMDKKIKPLIELQKYDGKNWVKVNGTFAVDETSGVLELKDFEPESTVNYRISASGVKTLKVGNYWGVNQMVKVNSDGDTPTAGFSRNTVVSRSQYWYDGTELAMQPTLPAVLPSPIDFTNNRSYVTSDNNRKNVILHLRFKEIDGVFPAKMSATDFNKYFKIVYTPTTPPVNLNTVANLKAATNLRYIGVKKVEYSTTQVDGEGKPDMDRLDTINVYLDPDYRIPQTPPAAPTKYLLIAPGFKYSGTGPGAPEVTFGDYANIDIEIGGVNCFGLYGAFTGLTF